MPVGDSGGREVDLEELFSPYELVLAELETSELETVYASSAIVEHNCNQLLDERAEEFDDDLERCLERLAERVENRRVMVESELAYRGK